MLDQIMVFIMVSILPTHSATSRIAGPVSTLFSSFWSAGPHDFPVAVHGISGIVTVQTCRCSGKRHGPRLFGTGMIRAHQGFASC